MRRQKKYAGKLHATRSAPGWEEEIIERVAMSRTARTEAYMHASVKWTHEFDDLLASAAQGRGISKSSYARRAVAAFVAHDLGLTFTETAPLLPAASKSRDLPRGYRKRAGSRDDGEGFGDWQIGGLS